MASELTLTCEDNMEMMARYPDKYFDLAIVDPPYGIEADKKNSKKELKCKNSSALSKNYGNNRWDQNIPNNLYFQELNRVSKRRIIWGANYFGLIGGMLYWHKNVTMPSYSTGELAHISWLNKVDFVQITWHGMIQHDIKNKETRIHPTQKPIHLYKWLLNKYADKEDKILDTHLGSMSIAIACYDMGFDLTGCELDPDYYEQGMKRVENHKKQLTIFG